MQTMHLGLKHKLMSGLHSHVSKPLDQMCNENAKARLLTASNLSSMHQVASAQIQGR